MRRHSAAYAILIGGLIAGAIDITYAIGFSAYHGVAPTRLLQSVSSGLLGRAAFEGGVPVAVLGFVLHFVMMMLIAAIFYTVAARARILITRPLLWGSLYGLVVYWVMNLVVLPLSAFPAQWRWQAVLVITSLIVHAFGIGVPIALASRVALSDTGARRAA